MLVKQTALTTQAEEEENKKKKLETPTTQERKPHDEDNLVVTGRLNSRRGNMLMSPSELSDIISSVVEPLDSTPCL